MTMDKKRAIFLESLSDRTARFLVLCFEDKEKKEKKKKRERMSVRLIEPRSHSRSDRSEVCIV